MFAILTVFGVFAWKKEKPVQLDIEVACPVCDRKVTKKELRPHLSEVHAEIYRLMKRTFWLLGPTLYGFLIYLLVLIGLIILDVFGKSFLAYALLLLFGPLFAWVTILAVVGVYMERRYLRPARKAWQVLRPRRRDGPHPVPSSRVSRFDGVRRFRQIGLNFVRRVGGNGPPGEANLPHEPPPFRRHRSAFLIPAKPVDDRFDFRVRPFERDQDRVPDVRGGLRRDAVLEDRGVRILRHPPDNEETRLARSCAPALRGHVGPIPSASESVGVVWTAIGPREYPLSSSVCRVDKPGDRCTREQIRDERGRLLRRGDDDGLARDLDPLPRLPLPEILPRLREDLLLDRRSVLLLGVASCGGPPGLLD